MMGGLGSAPRDESGPPTEAALLLCFAQQLASFSVDEMQSGAGWADDPLILVFGNIRIAIQLVLDVEAGRRAPENEMGHRSGYEGPANQTMM
jgi:hypothetical protein